MPNKDRNIPKRRFKEFENEDAWELRKLGELIDNLKGGVSITPNDYIENGYRTIPKGAVNDTGIADLSSCKNVSVDFFEKNYFSKTITGELITSLRDLVPSAPNLGRIVRIVGQFEEFIMPQGVYSLKTGENLLEDFLIAYSNCYIYRNVIQSEKNGSTQVHIRNGEFLNIKIQLPTLPEQKAIGTFFSTLDQQITLHQRKLDKLKHVKQAYLSEMFPAEGERVPKRRFPGFTDDWELRKFDKITFLAGQKNKNNLPYESYSVTNDKGFVPQNEQFEKGGTMATADKSMYYIVSPSSFAYNPARINIGSIGYYNQPENVIVSSLYEVFKTTDEVYDRFLWHWFKSDIFKKKIEELQEGGVRLYFYYDKLCKCSLFLPSIQEQKIIGDRLDSLDRQITLHQRKLEKLKNLKKALLNELFV
ncbi:TPA: restriction endonuclease subunit S [Streptococcus suis]